MAARKKQLGPIVLSPARVPPHLTRCHVCRKPSMAYATVDKLNPPWYICRECYEGMILPT